MLRVGVVLDQELNTSLISEPIVPYKKNNPSVVCHNHVYSVIVSCLAIETEVAAVCKLPIVL